MPGVELVWGLTLWVLWSCWLLCQYLRAPALVTHAGAALLSLELVLLLVHGFDCDGGTCGTAGRIAGSAASYDVPALAAVLVAAAGVLAWRRSRSS